MPETASPGAVQVRHAAANVRPDFHLAHVLHAHRNAPGRRAQHDVADIARGLGVAAAPHHVLGAAELHQPPTDIVVARPHRLHHFFDRHAVRLELHGVDIDLVLAHETAQRRHLRYARHGLKLVAQKPVLERAELRQVMLAAGVREHVLEYPADARRVGAELRAHPLAAAAAGRSKGIRACATAPNKYRYPRRR